MKFILEIELGNDAMVTGNDVAWALGEAAHRLKMGIDRDPLKASNYCRIRDINGNIVGKWEVID